MVTKNDRLINYIVDVLIVAIVSGILSVFLVEFRIALIISGLTSFFYYLIFESATGQTIGKMITKTEVRGLNNSKASFWGILVRTLARFSPFDWLSYMFGNSQGSHDALSRTRLCKRE
ncbi:MAG: putative RDD family membrane protein YckC [Patiriisocius sp.]|jgi:uncharacterized RDD family membrane protein YckC